MVPDERSDVGPHVNAFPVGSAYLFRHYFDGDAVFARLRRYYDRDQYRFAVPTGEFDGVRRFLAEHGYGLDPVANPEAFAVVVRKYTAHPEGIFKQSVLQRDHGDRTIFLLKDEPAVERAVADGAIRLRDSPVSASFGGQQRLSAVEG